MLKTYTAKYTRISSGYMGQLVEWPEVITEGKSLEDCRQLLQDALQEMIVAYRQQHKEIPVGGGAPHVPNTFSKITRLSPRSGSQRMPTMSYIRAMARCSIGRCWLWHSKRIDS